MLLLLTVVCAFVVPFSSAANECTPNPCGAGKMCIPESKQCFTTPCPQYRCENEPCKMPMMTPPGPGCRWVFEKDENGCDVNPKKLCVDPVPCRAYKLTDPGPGCRWVFSQDENGCDVNPRKECEEPCRAPLMLPPGPGCRWVFSKDETGCDVNPQKVCECTPNPCKAGQKCVSEPKQCITTPCDQYRCEARTPEDPPCAMPSMPRPREGCRWILHWDANGCQNIPEMVCVSDENACFPNPCKPGDLCVPKKTICKKSPCPQFICERRPKVPCAAYRMTNPGPGCRWVFEKDENGCNTNPTKKCECRMYKLKAPGAGCEYHWETDENGCKVNPQLACALTRDPRADLCAENNCKRNERCVPEPDMRCIRAPCPMYTCQPNECSPNPCKAGKMCIPEPKNCFTTPCPQYRCEDRPNNNEPTCPNGSPLHSPANCGRGGSRCPAGYFCNIHPADRYAVCCLDAEDDKQCKDPRREAFNDCGSACPKTCTQPNGSDMCTEQCVSACFCKNGYVRNEENGRCVRVNQCPQQQSACKDRRREEFKTCGSACPKTCSSKAPQICTMQCVAGCFCKNGYVRNEKTGKCVRQRNCKNESQCKNPRREVFKTCGTACPRTCSKPGRNQICTKQCVQGCFCRGGYVRNDQTGKCVRSRSCPNRRRNTL